MDITLWANADALQLIRLEAVLKTAGKTEQITIDDFAFDAPLEDSLFSFEIPKYYTAFTLALNTPDSRNDLTDFWKKIKNLSGQQFALSQNLSSIMGLIIPFRNQMLNATEKQQLLQMPIMIPMMKRFLIL